MADLTKLAVVLALVAAVQNAPVFPLRPTSATGSVPAGAVVLVVTGSCAATLGAGWDEETTLNGKMVLGTLVANGDIAGTGGADAITPAGTNTAPALTMNSYTPTGANAAPTLTMNSYTPGGSVAAPVLTMNSYTPAGTNGTGTVTATGTVAWPVNPPTNGSIALGTFVNVATATSGNCAATNIAAGTGSTTACKATAPNLTVPAEGHSGTLTSPTISYPANVPTFAGSSATTSAETFTGNAATLTGTNTAPAFTGNAATLTGTNTAPAFTGNAATLTGSNTAPAFTGTQFDNRSAYVKAIFCRKT